MQQTTAIENVKTLPFSRQRLRIDFEGFAIDYFEIVRYRCPRYRKPRFVLQITARRADGHSPRESTLYVAPPEASANCAIDAKTTPVVQMPTDLLTSHVPCATLANVHNGALGFTRNVAGM